MKRKLMDFKVRHIAKGGAAYATNINGMPMSSKLSTTINQTKGEQI